MDNKNYLYGAVGILALLLVLSLAMNMGIAPNDDVNDGINYEATVCRYVDRYDEGKGVYIREDEECSHNLLTNAGAEAIEQILGQGTAYGAFDYIGLCNATAGCTVADVTDTVLDNEYTDSGLQRAQGAYGSIGNGNWSIANTFTASADNLLTNSTGIFNDSASGTLLAENTFTLVTLQTNDQLTINWTIGVS